jgi:glucokinase
MRLVGDIGGTNARSAIAEPGKYPSEVRKLPVAQYPSLVEAVRTISPAVRSWKRRCLLWRAPYWAMR